MADFAVGPLEELPPGSMKIVNAGDRGRRLQLGGELDAIEDRCSHDDGPLCEGDWEWRGVVVCPRHGAHSTSAPASR